MSLVLMCLFLFFAIIMRIFLQYRNTKDYGIRASSLKSPLIEILPGTVFVLTFIFAFIFIFLKEFNLVQSPFQFPNFISLLGFLVGVIGIALTVVSQFQMGNSWRIGVDQKEVTQLITSGLYAKSRNPIYFGLLLFWIGISMTFTHPIIWLSALICWCCIELIVRGLEEPYLFKIHGNDFRSYFEQTNRYLPF